MCVATRLVACFEGTEAACVCGVLGLGRLKGGGLGREGGRAARRKQMVGQLQQQQRAGYWAVCGKGMRVGLWVSGVRKGMRRADLCLAAAAPFV